MDVQTGTPFSLDVIITQFQLVAAWILFQNTSTSTSFQIFSAYFRLTYLITVPKYLVIYITYVYILLFIVFLTFDLHLD